MKKNKEIEWFVKEESEFHCPVCKRLTPPQYIEKHHLHTKQRGGKDTERVCCNCGDMVHQLFTNKELDRKFNTIEKLCEHPAIQEWIRFIQKKPDSFSVCMKTKKRRN